MADSSNYARLREQTMGSMLEEEAVTVNTRALIDKVLARYSGEWTTLRELIQNAADAQASHVTIRFETIPSSTIPFPQSSAPAERLKHTLLHHTLKTLLVSNDGEVFGENDWSRLKRIAEGNPDETKIGAFGVGFYSVFADCESPFVSSGNQSMAFYWKKDSLFTRRGKLDGGDAKKDTTFLLDYRNQTTPVPQLLSICQFLATSLTFVGLSGIDLFIDDWHILKLTKKMAPGVNISLPKDVNPRTKDGLMKITAVEYQNAQIDARWMNVVGWNKTTQTVALRTTGPPQEDSGAGSLRGWFSRIAGGINSSSVAAKRAQKEEEALQQAIIEDLAGFSNATVFLRLSTVNVQTSVSRSLAAELERATKKPPPKHTKIAILTSSYDEASASMSTISGAGSKSATSIFASVLPTKNGKIFIGFPTAQTTGLLAHISAPSVIPTVERESIDLNARYVRDWNVEILRVAGIACRIAFTGEMIELKNKLERSMSAQERKKVTPEDITALMPAAVHVLKQYNYEESTPSAKVGQFIEEAFWTCNQKASIDILSTRGVLPSQQVRVATEDLSFVEGIPVIPEQLMKQANEFISKLRDYGLLSDITTSDIKRELEAQALNEAQVIELLKWAAKKVSSQELDAGIVQNLFDGTIATIKEDFIATSSSPVIQMGEIKTFVNTAKIPAELPVPPTTIPFRLTRTLNVAQLTSLGWEELQLVPWTRWVVETDGNKFAQGASFTRDAAVACQVLPVLSKGWDTLSAGSKQTIVDLLTPRTIIPTKLGMRKPPQAYFASVKLFDDLPTIYGLQSVKEKFLSALGVRKTVELNVVFERLMAKSQSTTTSEDGKWSHVDLIRYLLSVKDDIPAEDIKRLRSTPICPAESKIGEKSSLYKLSELYEPNDAIRKLGLPVLQWPGVYRAATPEGRFLRNLGLQPYPDVPALVNILNKAPASGDLQRIALEYFMSNTFHNGYNQYPMSKIDTAFLPVQPFPGETGNMIAKPSQCFANPRAAALRFRILRSDLQPQHAIFGVAMDPPIETCAERLIKQPPLDREQSKTLFGYFAGRLNEINPSSNLANRLGNAPIVPILEGRSEKRASGVRFVSPVSVFLGDSEAYGDIFDFVDFGLEANSFLLRVGSKHEPSASEIAYMVVRQPARLLSTLGAEKYLQLLRRLADNAAALKKDKTLWAQLKQSECLLAVKETTRATMAGGEKVRDIDDDEHIVREYSLASAGDVVIVDDFGTYRLFQNDLLCAPQEEPLENFYAALDTPFLSRLIEDDQRMGALLRDQTLANKLKKLIVERCRLFLHDHSPDAIRHDAKWVEKSVDVRATEFLRITRRLRGYRMQFIEKRTAALHRESKKDAVLYVTAQYDLFEVSRALMSLLLKRPRQQDYLALETIMESDLRRLKTKGYNVDRILRQKAEESKIAASERQKREEEQRRLAAEAEEQSRAAGIAAGAAAGLPMRDAPPVEPSTTPEKSLSMPGAFESPEQALMSHRGKKMTNLFSQLKNQLGFNAGEGSSTPSQHMQSMLGGNDFPPPYDAQPRPGKSITTGTERVTSPQDLQRNLTSAVKASREYNQSELFSRPQTNNIKDIPSYCDSKPGHNLAFIGEVGQGIKFFIGKDHSGPRAFMESNKDALAAFVVVLINCAAIFELPAKTLNVYYDESGPSIAFNSNGSIFCNLRFFMQLHEENMVDAKGRMEAMSYWWITMCHELAHNLVSDHSAEHSYYTESFAHHYFGRMVWWIGRNIPSGAGP